MKESDELNGVEDGMGGVDKDGSKEGGTDGKGEDESDPTESAESEKPKGLRSPAMPSRREWEEHQLTHLPFRDWCPHCVKCRSQNNPHKRNADEDKDEEEKNSSMTTVAFDYAYLNEKMHKITEDEYERLKAKGDKLNKPIIVVHDRRSGAIAAHAVECKETGDKWACTRTVEDAVEMGYDGESVVTKCDQEPAIKKLQSEIGEMRRGITVPRNSLVGDSSSNGPVENAVKRFTAQLRTLKDSLEAKSKVQLPTDHPVFEWLIEWSANVLNRCWTEVGRPHTRIYTTKVPRRQSPSSARRSSTFLRRLNAGPCRRLSRGCAKASGWACNSEAASH